mmetsp:Transcript_24400/g.64187  ORF Transcript_24400/g.64187 Transcript_24400/m.64187 type:complete len:201 (-) Transcript_24400:338-940(-)
MFCKACTSSDKVADTIKFDNAQALKRRQEELARAEQAMEAEKQRRHLEEQRRASEERHARERAVELQRQEEEAADVQRQQEQEEKRRRMEESERRRKEEALKAAAARKRKEECERRKLEEWLAAKKFEEPNKKKSKWFKSSLPLHEAVIDVDAEMVRLLVDNNADVNALNSSKQTPYQLAEKLSQKAPNAYDGVLAALRG